MPAKVVAKKTVLKPVEAKKPIVNNKQARVQPAAKKIINDNGIISFI